MPLRKRGYSKRILRARGTARKLFRRAGFSLRAAVPFRVSHLFSTITATGTAQDIGYSFNLSDLPNYAEYQALFDQYKLKKVVMRFEPCYTSNDTGGMIISAPGVTPVVTSMNPMINKYCRVVKDYDDNTALSAETDYFEYDNMKSFSMLGKPFTMTVYPKMKLTTGGNTDVSVSPRWIDLDNVNVPHYGVKLFVPECNFTSAYWELRVLATYYFQCKNRK